MTISANNLHYVSDLVRARSAIVLGDEKAYLVEARLAPLAHDAGFASVDALVIELKSTPANDLHVRVVEAMTTNETSFFRDGHPFEALRTLVVPTLASAYPARPLRIWCAAASTGQEAYSVAMIVREHFPALPVEIIATDLNLAVLERARSGIYRASEVRRGLPPALLARYFDAVGSDWQVKEDLRRMVKFRTLNLAIPWPTMPLVDVILLRNVLIYFDADTKKGILARAREQLTPGGYLMLGSTESALGLSDKLLRVRAGASTIYRPARSGERAA